MEEVPIHEGAIRVSCIAIGSTQTYILYFLDYDNYNAAVEQWPEIVDVITSANVALYKQIFRSIFNIPAAAELDEERELIWGRFGEQPTENEEFINLMNQAKMEYEKHRDHYPKFIQWVTDNFDCEYEMVSGIFHFEG